MVSLSFSDSCKQETEQLFCRLLEFAGLYYDLASFPESEAKRALQRVVKKKFGKVEGGDRKDDRKAKKQRR